MSRSPVQNMQLTPIRSRTLETRQRKSVLCSTRPVPRIGEIKTMIRDTLATCLHVDDLKVHISSNIAELERVTISGTCPYSLLAVGG